MHHPLFGHPFAVIVAPILLSTLAFNLLNRKKASVRRVAEDADTGISGSSTVPTETDPCPSSSSAADSDASSSSIALKEIDNSAFDPSTTRSGVFLSFKGSDTGKGFTNHLYIRLIHAGIRPFINDNDLHQGEEFCQQILGVINKSKILIPIISANYGSSKSCLDELVQIVRCKNNNVGHIILPIFYKVEPTHVQHQIRRFGDAFSQDVRRCETTILEKWKEALTEVSSMKGWEAKRFEGELVKSVVQKVLNELNKEFKLITSNNLVGIHSHVGRIMEVVDDNPSATIFVGIHGMPGVGKTTLAETIYNMLSNQFEYRSSIHNIKESIQHNGGLEYLQNMLIRDITKQPCKVYNKDEGTRLLSSKFKRKKVLILLDDVDEDDQLKALAGNHNWFSSGSRILITARDKRILDNVGVDYNHEHKELDKDQSLILLSRYAFQKDAPLSKFDELSHDVVSAIGGIPLILEIVGKFLCGKNERCWRGAIERLRAVPDHLVEAKLKISFDALDKGQKEIFLDVACFFSGTDRRIASYMWDVCGFSPEEGIEVLQFMSLIKVGDNNELKMHDQLRNLGRQIVHDEDEWPQRRSRLWNFKEVLKVLEGKEGTRYIKAISSELSRGTVGRGGDVHTDEQFKNLTRLRILHASGAHFSGDFENSFTELRWLRWRYCPLTFEANNFHVKKLVVLDLSRSEILDQWRGWSSIMMAEKLKFLDLTLCRYLKGTFFLSAFKNLEVLILQDCHEVERIDSSIGDMKSLVSLDLTRCRRLKELPVEVGNLVALEQLLLQDNEKISAIPNIGALQSLEILDISGTGIKELPNGIERVKKLRVLDASRCIKLGGEMPKSIHNFSSLQHLDFHGCQKLQWMPELPSSLTYLSVTCQSHKLPSLSHLVHLKELQLLDCRFLECILELPSTPLELLDCYLPTSVEESNLPRTLNLPFKLEILKMCCCKSMKTLDVSQLNYLRRLSVEDCTNVHEIRGLDKLKYLENLIITKCTSIEKLDLLNIEHLKILHIEDCEKLVEIQGLDRLKFLEELNISRCTLIKRLDLAKSKGLKILNAKYCKKLVEIQGLERLEFLEVLNISRCTLIERLDLSKSERLKILEAKDCKKLVEIQGFDRLKFLEELDISWWASIERLDLQESKSLKILNANHCENLVEIQHLDKLEFLEELNISSCTSIERLDLPKSKDMKLLDAQKCKNLVEIQGLDKLEFLEELNVSKCASIERLDLSKFKYLKTFDARDCKKLIEIQGIERLEFLEGYTSSIALQIEGWNS